MSCNCFISLSLLFTLLQRLPVHLATALSLSILLQSLFPFIISWKTTVVNVLPHLTNCKLSAPIYFILIRARMSVWLNLTAESTEWVCWQGRRPRICTANIPRTPNQNIKGLVHPFMVCSHAYMLWRSRDWKLTFNKKCQRNLSSQCSGHFDARRNGH